MKWRILALALTLPFLISWTLICDPQDGVTKYEVVSTQINSGQPVEVDAQADGSLRFEIPPVNQSGQVRAGGMVTLNDEPQPVFAWSEPSPFVLAGAAPAAPNGLRIEK